MPLVVGDAPGPAPQAEPAQAETAQAETAPAAFTDAPVLPVSFAAQAAEMGGALGPSPADKAGADRGDDAQVVEIGRAPGPAPPAETAAIADSPAPPVGS